MRRADDVSRGRINEPGLGNKKMSKRLKTEGANLARRAKREKEEKTERRPRLQTGGRRKKNFPRV